jgi:threonine/homoserine/homoserine lactone efflux protein
MDDLLPGGPLLSAFIVASLVLALTPGPAVIYVITRTVSQGRRAGLASVLGVALGNFGNAVGAALGLAALFALSTLAFAVVKYAGAAYLIYLGIKALRKAAPGLEATGAPIMRVPLGTVFRDGFVVALLNPKTALFFAAFLPQFMTPGGSPMLQSISLGALFVAIATVTDMAYVLLASSLSPALSRLRGASDASRYITAGAFIGLGLFTATAGSRPVK